MQTYIFGPTFMRTAVPSTMRVQNSAGDFADFPVPRLDANTPSYTFDCVLGSCLPTSWATAIPITLTVDYFNQVFEHDETNNVSTMNWPPPMPTPCPPETVTVTPTPTGPPFTRTRTPTPTQTQSPTATPTPCPMNFSDVRPTDWFYEYVRYLYCDGDISGYADGTFRPYNSTNRGQTVKIVVLGFNIPIYVPPPPLPCTFGDACTENPFHPYIETAVHHELISGYADGTFRPFNLVTRAQTAKIVMLAAQMVRGWTLINPTTPSFSDVPQSNPFYTYIETGACYSIINGYGDGTFRPFNNATRGQISQKVWLGFNSNRPCSTPGKPQGASRVGLLYASSAANDYTIQASVPLTTATASPTFARTPTATPCPMSFSDVQPTDYFYEAVRYLYCDGVVSGYADGTFRPYSNVTRAQSIKMIVLSYNIPFYTPPSPTFPCDVPPSHPFYIYIESYWHFVPQGIGFPPECFRPYNWMTRGQLAKVIVTAGCWTIYTPPVPTFRDVPTTDTFYQEIETAYHLGVISGYSCGPGCLEYRPYNTVTRGQASKIIQRGSLIGTSCTSSAPEIK
jgi:hypothetical protein